MITSLINIIQINMPFPILRLDTEIVKNNIARMVSKAKELNLELRPHFKTHQSRLIGTWFKEQGIKGITVSSFLMADFFSRNGCKDITVAFPALPFNVNHINRISSLSNINILVQDVDSVKAIDSALTARIGAYIEIDPNYGRSGININSDTQIESVVEAIRQTSNMQFVGFYSHAGHTYKCSGNDKIKDLTEPIIIALSAVKNKYGGKICWGDTPSCSILDNFGMIDQLSPGNFVFYDWMQYQIGSCDITDIALIMECPVVAKFQDRKELLIHGGAVHFSKDYVELESGIRNYGQVINPNNSDDKTCFLKSVSQEHGVISCSGDFFDKTTVGDLIRIIPIHSCLTANLMGAYQTESGEYIEQFRSGSPFKS